MSLKARVVFACGLCAWGLTACAPPPDLPRVFVASSAHAMLREVFPHAVLVAGPSHMLRTQIEHGARAALFVSADAADVRTISKLRQWSSPTPIMRAQVLAASRDPAITHVRQLPDARHLVLAHPHVPLGRYTQRVLGAPGLGARALARARSLESQASHVRLKAMTGAADASVLYSSDLRDLPHWHPLQGAPTVHAQYVAVSRGPQGARLMAQLRAHDPARWGFEPPQERP